MYVEFSDPRFFRYRLEKQTNAGSRAPLIPFFAGTNRRVINSLWIVLHFV